MSMRSWAEVPRADMATFVTSAYDLARRIDTLDAPIRAFVTEHDRAERVAAQAQCLGQQYPSQAGSPPLFGIPVAVKDVFHVSGLPTRAGSLLNPGHLTGPESELVARVRRAGGIILGKTHLDEFACCAPGPTRHPHALWHTPGGSRAGSAAARP